MFNFRYLISLKIFALVRKLVNLISRSFISKFPKVFVKIFPEQLRKFKKNLVLICKYDTLSTQKKRGNFNYIVVILSFRYFLREYYMICSTAVYFWEKTRIFLKLNIILFRKFVNSTWKVFKSENHCESLIFS